MLIENKLALMRKSIYLMAITAGILIVMFIVLSIGWSDDGTLTQSVTVICALNNSFLFKSNGTWGCGDVTGLTINYTINNNTYINLNESDPIFTTQNQSIWDAINLRAIAANVWAAIAGNRTQIETNTNNAILGNWSDLEERKLNRTDQRFNETAWVLSNNYISSEVANATYEPKMTPGGMQFACFNGGCGMRAT